jgi:hypothetical protein
MASDKIIPRKLLLIFDIDETLIHFVSNQQDKEVLDAVERHKGILDLKTSKQGHYTIIRPHIKELFAFLKENRDKIDVALWTYSDREYANGMADMIIKYCNLEDPDFFVFKFCNEDIIDEDYPKDLTYIWHKYPKKYNMFNTFLVDDRAANVYHDVNIENSILIQPFAPFGPELKRVFITDEHVERSARDEIFLSLIEICKGLIQDVDGCSDEEVRDAFKVECTFNPSRVKRMKLDQYLKKYMRVLSPRIQDEISLMTIGEPHLTPKIVINPTSLTGGSYLIKLKSGSARKRRRTNRKKQSKKSTKYKKRRTVKRSQRRRMRRNSAVSTGNLKISFLMNRKENYT